MGEVWGRVQIISKLEKFWGEVKARFTKALSSEGGGEGNWVTALMKHRVFRGFPKGKRHKVGLTSWVGGYHLN